MKDGTGFTGLSNRGVTVFKLTFRQIVKSRSTLVVLLLCLIPFILSVAWSSGWRPEQTITEDEVDDDYTDRHNNDIRVRITHGTLDFREVEGSKEVIVERSIRGTSQDWSDTDAGVDTVQVECFVNTGLDSGADTDGFSTMGLIRGISLMSTDLASLPSDVAEDFYRSLNNTPPEDMGHLMNLSLFGSEGIYHLILQNPELMEYLGEFLQNFSLGGPGGEGQENMSNDGPPPPPPGGEIPDELDPGAFEMVLEVLELGIFELEQHMMVMEGATQIFLFGTGPDGLDDWSSWRCYVNQSVDGSAMDDIEGILELLGQGGLEINNWRAEADRIPLQVDRGEVRGYVGVKAVEQGFVFEPIDYVKDLTGVDFSETYGGEGDEEKEEEEEEPPQGKYNVAWNALEFRGADPDAEYGYDIFQEVAGNFYLFFIIPITCLLYASVSITNEVSSRTMTFLTSRPISRRELYLHRFAGYYAGTLVITLPPLIATFFMFGSQGGDYLGHWDLLSTFLIVSALYVLVLGALFFVFCTLTGYPLVLGLIYIFFWEAAMSQTSFAIRRFTLNFYMRSIIDERLPDTALIHAWHPVALGDAYLIMAAVFVAFILFGMFVFSRREYH